MVRRAAATLAVIAAFSSSGSSQSARAPQIESIKASEMRPDLFFLSSDAMQGRLTDTRENAIAGDWVRSRFERLGLKPGGQNGSFDHRYNLMKASLGEGNAMSIGAVGTGGTHAELRLGGEFYPHRFSANAAAEGTVVFAGFGIVSPERQHDDYRDGVRGSRPAARP